MSLIAPQIVIVAYGLYHSSLDVFSSFIPPTPQVLVALSTLFCADRAKPTLHHSQFSAARPSLLAIRPEAVGSSWQQSLDGLEELRPYFVSRRIRTMTYYRCTVGTENIRTLHLRDVTSAYVVAMNLYGGQVYSCCACTCKAPFDQEPPRYFHSAQHLNVLGHW